MTDGQRSADIIEEQRIDVGGLTTQYLVGGTGPPLVLLHGVGDSAQTWQRVLPSLALRHRVYAPSLPGFGGSAKPLADYSPAFFTGFVESFLDTEGVEEATVLGNSLGGLVAMRLALAEPARVTALGLVGSAGLGREVHFALRAATLPGVGEVATRWNRTPVGAAQWASAMATLLFARYRRVPPSWWWLQYRQARQPRFLEATVATLRGVLTPTRQRQILLPQLPRLTVPTLVVWGTGDRVVPSHHAHSAVSRLPRGRLALIPDCGHVPQLERPSDFVATLIGWLAEQAPSPRIGRRPS